jgi:polyisoprenoid-binding protein YceI
VKLATRPFAGTYQADPVHSSVGFRVLHMGVSTFAGSFADVAARLSGEDGKTTLEGVAMAESISITAPPEFRAHVLGEEFLDAGRYPAVSFRSDQVELRDDGSASADGELTIKGINRPVAARGRYTAPVDDPFGGRRGALELEATVDRRDFDMDWNMALPNGGEALGTEVTLSVRLELVQNQEG